MALVADAWVTQSYSSHPTLSSIHKISSISKNLCKTSSWPTKRLLHWCRN